MKNLENTIGHVFQNKALLEEALTHSSVAGKTRSYERMEFLGDRVLSLVIAEMLFERFPNEEEGALAKRHSMLVKQGSLEKIAEKIGIDKAIRYATRDTQHGPSKSMISDVLESVIAALYMDAGFEKAREFILSHWSGLMLELSAPPEDPKSSLQEWAQARGIALPNYTIADRSGPDHNPVFVVEVSLQGFEIQKGEGASKQSAEKNAAIQLLRIVREEK